MSFRCVMMSNWVNNSALSLSFPSLGTCRPSNRQSMAYVFGGAQPIRTPVSWIETIESACLCLLDKKFNQGPGKSRSLALEQNDPHFIDLGSASDVVFQHKSIVPSYKEHATNAFIIITSMNHMSAKVLSCRSGTIHTLQVNQVIPIMPSHARSMPGHACKPEAQVATSATSSPPAMSPQAVQPTAVSRAPNAASKLASVRC